MSEQYQIKFGDVIIEKQEMRKHCQRPGKVDENGKIEYTTEQHHKAECDVNNIIAKYDKTGLINHIQKIEASYGNMTGLEFKEMSDLVAGAKSAFNELPTEIRKEFDNNPELLLKFMEDPENRDRAIELGLIDADTPADKDGFGEHVKLDDIIQKLTKTEEKKDDSESEPEVKSNKTKKI